MSFSFLISLIKQNQEKILTNELSIFSINQNINLFDLYLQSTTTPKVYFKSKDSLNEFFGLGQAKLFSSKESLQSKCPIFYNQVFDEERVQEQWSSFGKRRVFNSFITIEKSKEITKIYIKPKDKSIEQLCQLLVSDSQSGLQELPALRSIQNIPSFDKWDKSIKNSIDSFEKDIDFDKVVLARKLIQYYEDDIDHASYINHFVQQEGYKFIYLFNYEQDKTFISISPESLLKLVNKTLSIDVIAGTRATDCDEQKDTLNENALKNDDKEIREHRYVAANADHKLTYLCKNHRSVFEQKVLKQKHVQHLYSLYKGELKDNIEFNDIVDQLHPTPAVCGTPTIQALRAIRNHEQFERGLYSAPCGVITENYTELIVAIRSALLEKNIVNIYAGAGIVCGSKSEYEWKETHNKMRNFLLPL